MEPVLAQGMNAAPGLCHRNWYRFDSRSRGSYLHRHLVNPRDNAERVSPLYYASEFCRRTVGRGRRGVQQPMPRRKTNLGASTTPTTNSWRRVTSTSGWTHIGDAAVSLLANGTFMIGNLRRGRYRVHQPNLPGAAGCGHFGTWTIIGAGNGKADQNSEKVGNLLPAATF